MRKLVTVRIISDVIPIDGADAVELVKIDGWQCVTKKNEFRAGDKCLYHEVDSFLPTSDERYSFLAGRGEQTNVDGSKGYRLKTIKLRGQLSQGLALPVDLFKTEMMLADSEDLSEALGVTKWEPAIPACLSGQAKGTFPSFLKKTDQERIQNMPWVVETEGLFEVTQKLDGSSCTVFFNNGEFGVCSRNLELKETEGNSFWQIANRLNLKERLSALGRNIALQGELVGPGIQSNPHKLSQHELYIYDIYLIDEQCHASATVRHEILRSDVFNGIKSVPHVDMMYLKGQTVGSLLKMAEDEPDQLNPTNPAPEGLVFKHVSGSPTFKAISTKYLLKEK